MRKVGKIIIVIAVVLIIVWLYYEYHINVRPKKQQLLVLRNYNGEAGFHWMGVHNVIVAANEAKRRGLKLVVILDGGLYIERNGRYQEEYKEFVDPGNNEWFGYYFEPIGVDEPEINALWKSGALDGLPSYMLYNYRKNAMGYRFDRASYDAAAKDIDYSGIFAEVIRMKPYLLDKIKDFYERRLKGKFLVGIHARGTDKFVYENSHENNPRHFAYDQYADAVEKEMVSRMGSQERPVAALVCSDEQPFIDHMHRRLGKKYDIISVDDIIRSDVDTGGVNMVCSDEDPICARYKNASIHRGMRDKSNYKKGLDSIYEVALLSKCHVFYKSRGNFSNSVAYINPNIEVVDMVSSLV